MKPLRFYEHFAAAYGTQWLIMLVMALVSQSHINAGAFGVYGFPLVALLYAFVRRHFDRQAADPDEEPREGSAG